MRPVTLAKQQPVALLAVHDSRPQQAAQPGQPGTVADQDHRCRSRRQMETAVAAQPHAHARAQRQVFGQPARAQAQRAVRMTLLAHDQLQHTVTGNRGDG
uniref:Secreted protein n=1 Tax=Steinernema glaseri TaxID=37863 RepID=A0A1I8AA55_9BILA